MASSFSFTVNVTCERETGKFMSRDEMQEQIQDALDSADPGSIDGGPDGDSVYEVTEWEVSCEEKS
jgi:hypothetical protein